LRNTPDEIDCTLTGYFAICGEHKLLSDYLFPPYNIRIIVYCESDQIVKDWMNQLSQLLNDEGIKAKFQDKGTVLEINTLDEELNQWVPAIVISGEE
jgi:hypothetical protein